MHIILGKCKEALNSFVSRLKCALHQGQSDDMLDATTLHNNTFSQKFVQFFDWFEKEKKNEQSN